MLGCPLTILVEVRLDELERQPTRVGEALPGRNQQRKAGLQRDLFRQHGLKTGFDSGAVVESRIALMRRPFSWRSPVFWKAAGSG